MPDASELDIRRAKDRTAKKKAYNADPAKYRTRSATWRAMHPEQLRTHHKKYFATHKEEICARQKAYHRIHREQILARDATYRASRREELREKSRAYRAANPAKAVEQQRQNRAKHPDVHRAIAQRKRARKAQAPMNDFTAKQWQDMKTAYGHRCVYCQRKMQRLTMDHITPLSQGGAHTLVNIVPACQSCNAKKIHRGATVPYTTINDLKVKESQMYGPLIKVLQDEWRSKFEGPVPPPAQLMQEPWVGPFLRLFAPSHPANPRGEEHARHDSQVG